SAMADATSADLVLDRLRPEWRAGGFARDNGGVAFFTRVNALIEPGMVVVDFGAGRGEAFQGPDTYFARLARLQGKAARVIGIDVDGAIADHPFLDERYIIAPGAALPLADASVDMIVADWVFEHIAEPQAAAAEFDRVLKPGGWILARTPNAAGYVGIGARLVPNRLHTRLLKRLWPGRAARDVFPTAYRLNSPEALRAAFPPAAWRHYSYRANPTPKYFGRSPLLFRLIAAFQALVPGPMRTDLIVILRKR
ncbi:MAG TPA: methyltransferase domain-containing protein, partial [Caulobacteraceae bacterium]